MKKNKLFFTLLILTIIIFSFYIFIKNTNLENIREKAETFISVETKKVDEEESAKNKSNTKTNKITEYDFTVTDVFHEKDEDNKLSKLSGKIKSVVTSLLNGEIIDEYFYIIENPNNELVKSDESKEILLEKLNNKHQYNIDKFQELEKQNGNITKIMFLEILEPLNQKENTEKLSNISVETVINFQNKHKEKVSFYFTLTEGDVYSYEGVHFYSDLP